MIAESPFPQFDGEETTHGRTAGTGGVITGHHAARMKMDDRSVLPGRERDPDTSFDEATPASVSTPTSGPKRYSSDELEALFRQLAPVITAGLRRAFGNGPPDPEDVTQLAFQKLLERAHHADIRSIHAFVWRTARNLVLKAKRAHRVRSKYDFEVEQIFFPLKGNDQPAERVIIAREQLRSVNAALRAMPETRRRAFLLHKIERLSIADVARRLSIGKTTAHKHIVRAARDIDLRLATQENDAD
ncbi:MAG: sigma-70 family RNA polymerase sigma factor [Pseudomonadota bacterium]